MQTTEHDIKMPMNQINSGQMSENQLFAIGENGKDADTIM